MKKVKIKNNVKIKGVKNFRDEKKVIDYFLLVPGCDEVYAFSRNFTKNAYDMCKAGISLNDLRSKKSKDAGIMKLVNYTNFMMPFLAEYYELPLAN